MFVLSQPEIVPSIANELQMGEDGVKLPKENAKLLDKRKNGRMFGYLN